MTLTAPHNGVDSIPVNRELRIQTVPRVAQRTQITYELDFGVRLGGEQEAIERLLVHLPRRVGEHTELTIRTLTFGLWCRRDDHVFHFEKSCSLRLIET